MEERQRFIVTGGQGSGKTTFCQTLINHAQEARWRVAGILSPPVFERGEKVGIDVIDLSTGLRRRLANPRGGEEIGPQTIQWTFDSDVLAWGNAVLGEIPLCDLFIIDELGPLEFERGEGWLNGISAVEAGQYKFAVIVIRPHLVEKALQKWPDASVIEVIHPNQASTSAEELFSKMSG
jgi:nucleoside-triphosphatase THEP1